ncbi:MAG: hypothetical protein IJD46_01030 [Bacilli bacterium]|nr:hypothetical protein [Bacilli bacterium]
MSCQNVKRLCKRLVISESVTFVDDTLLIDIPTGSYADGEKYCIVVAQTLPDTTTITAPVAITIGGDTTTTYPLINCDCTNVYACSINRRTRYSVCVHTGIADGVFKLMGRLPCSRCADNALALPIPAAAATPGV